MALVPLLMRDSLITPAISHRYNYPHVPQIIISSGGVVNVMEGIKLFSATSPDYNNWKVLKGYFKLFFVSKFQGVPVFAHPPHDWCIGKVIGIIEKCNQRPPLNYHSIALACNSCKILEHKLYSDVTSFVEMNSLFSPDQRGQNRTTRTEYWGVLIN